MLRLPRFGVHSPETLDEVVAALAVFLAGLSVPSISTIHPAHVIEDPAIMFVFGGTLAMAACLLTITLRTTPRAQPDLR